VSESSLEIRNAFVRKVYTILCMSRLSPKDRIAWVANPLLLFPSRTDRKPALFCAMEYETSLILVTCPARHNYRRRCAFPIHIRSPLGSSQVRLPLSSRYYTLILTQSSPWSFYVPMFGVFVNLGLLYWKRHQHPLNLVLLSTFTLLESFTLGVLCAYFDNTIVLQALYVRFFTTACDRT
jgi:FtsH-binding integral membrane protein